MTGTINLGDEWEITADETVDDLVIRHKPTANSFTLGADGTFTPLPELAITSVTTVPDKAARLSVSAQEGDIVIQTDVSKTFVLTTNDPTVDSNWVEIQIDVLNTIDGQQITPSQVGTSSNRTDVVADTVDANQLTGVSTGGKTTLKSGDNVKIATISNDSTNATLQTLVDQPNTPFKLYAGHVSSGNPDCDWEYTFDDGSTINRTGGTGFQSGKQTYLRTQSNGDVVNPTVLPPATNLVKIRVGADQVSHSAFGAEAVYADL